MQRRSCQAHHQPGFVKPEMFDRIFDITFAGIHCFAK